MVNKVMLVGRAGNDGSDRVKELKNSGSIMVNLSIATWTNKKDRNGQWEEQTTWHNCIAFGKSAEYVEKYIKKGDYVYVEGSIDAWKSNDGVSHTSIKIDRVSRFAGMKQDARPRQQAGANGHGYRDQPRRGGGSNDWGDNQQPSRDRRGRDDGPPGYSDSPPENDIPF